MMQEQQRPRLRQRRLLDVSLVVVAIAAMGVQLGRLMSSSDELLDLQIYRAGAQALLDGSPLYSLHYHVLGLPFTYTPFAALVFVPLALLSTNGAAVLMTGLSIAALLRVSHLLAREVRPRAVPSWSVLEVTVLLFVFGVAIEPVAATLAYGQVNLVIMWLVVEDLLRRKPGGSGGALIGVATGIKLVPGLFIVFLLLTRRVRDGLVAIAVLGLTVVAGFLVQPDQAWQYWTGIAYDPSRVGGVAYISNQSLNGVITRLTQPGGNRVLWGALALLVVASSLWAGRRLWLHGAKVPAIATIAVAILLVSPISWSHHWVWFVVAAAALLDRSIGHWAVRVTLLLTTTAIAASHVIWTVPHERDLEYLHSRWEVVRGNAYAEWAVVMLVVFAIAAWRSPEVPPEVVGPTVGAAGETELAGID